MVTWDDFDKIWASTSPLTPYDFSDSNYSQGWNFVGSTPPARQMWDSIQKKNDEKFKYLRDNFGTPNIVTQASQMTDTEKVYVYMGSEAGWNSGHWYYYDEGTSSWADGGVYNSVAFVTDTTLSIAGQPADAKATGDALALKSDLAGCTFTGNVSVNADFSVTGDATIGTDLSVTGSSTLTGNVSANGDVTVTGDVSSANLTTSADATIGGDLSVTGTTSLTGNVTAGDVTANDVSVANINASNNGTIGGNLSVSGTTTLTGDVSASADLIVAGDSSLTNLSVSGTTALAGTSTAPTPSADDNSTKIATTEYVQTEIKPIETDVTINDKRITNIEKLLQGNLYDYQTDSSSAYTKSVPSGAMPYAGVEKVGGKTVVWNQLSDFGTITLVGTSFFKPYKSGVSVVSGHKYFYAANFTSSSEANPVVYIFTMVGGSATIVASVNKSSPKAIFTSSYSATSTGAANVEGGLWEYGNSFVVDDKVSIMLVDLTLLYGAGNEPTTVAEFQQTFPAVWYAFNEGTLLSAGVTEVKSVGRNLFYSTTNSYSSTPNGIAVNWDKDTQTITLNGTNTKTDSAWISINLDSSIDWVAGESYTISSNGSSALQTGLYFNATYYDTNGTLKAFSLSNGTFTVPADYGSFGYVQIGVFKTATTISTTIKVQIEKGSTATEYVPYANPLATYPIPAEIQALEGYGWSAGSVYNYIDYERKVFVKNVASVDLGTLNWTYYAYSGYSGWYSSGIKDYAKRPTTSSEVTNILTTVATTVSDDRFNANNNGTNICYNQVGNIKITIPNVTDSASLKSALNGVYLYYELATPQETDISAYLTDDNLISVEAGGSLTFPNSNGDDYRIPVPSAETYMVDLQSALGE